MRLTVDQEIALLEEKKRILSARSSFKQWCITQDIIPARHHELIIDELEKVVRGECPRLMILMPPGTAKSTYISKLFPPWYLAQKPNCSILSCSHSGDFATIFGRAARNFAESNERLLGYTLSKDSRAANEWETSNGGRYYCTGVGAGLSGHRADLGVIDDFVGKEEEVNSKTFHDKIWDWYINDFVPRLKPNAARVIIANHRNEDDLVGRLLQKEADKWRVVRLRLVIENKEQEEHDPLHRHVGEHIWPEYFTRTMVEERMRNPSASGIEQQEPAPVEGVFFKASMMKEYDLAELPAKNQCHAYAASDHAVRTKESNDNTCMGIGYYRDGFLYIHPDLVWDKIPTNVAVEQMLRLGKEYSPLQWWAERENISGSIGPFLQERQLKEHNWFSIVEVSHQNKDLMGRCQPIHALMSMGRVKFPRFASWYQRARKEVLSFPNAKHDDFVSFLAHLGRGIHQMIPKQPVKVEAQFDPTKPWVPTMRWIKDQSAYRKRLEIARMDD